MNREFKQGDIYNPEKKEEIIEAVRCLQLGEQVFFHESDYGLGYILNSKNGFECWSVPTYGGEERLEYTVDTVIEAVEILSSWT